MKWCRGVTREVFLTRRWAVKIPSVRCWRLFLTGLLANLHESLWWTASGRDPRLCPVRWAAPGGLVLVMPRADPITDAEYDALDLMAFEGLPADHKAANFGRFGGRIVMLDYG